MASVNENNVHAAEQNAPPQPESPSLEQQNSGSRTRLTKARILGTAEASFRVYKFPGDEEKYLLELHQVGKDYIDRHILVQGRDENDATKYCIKSSEAETGAYVVYPMTTDPDRPKFMWKYPLPLQDRLVGWTIERRARTSTQKEELFYKHSLKTFRSFVDVAGFILYSCEPRYLQLANQEAEVAED